MMYAHVQETATVACGLRLMGTVYSLYIYIYIQNNNMMQRYCNIISSFFLKYGPFRDVDVYIYICWYTSHLPGMYMYVYIYVTVNCGNQALPGMPEIFRQYWECL